MAYVTKLTIDSSKIPSDLTDFPVYVDLSDMNAEFWSTVANGGGDIRVFKSDGTTELPREVVSCNTSTDTGELHFKYTGTLSGSVDTEVQIHADGTSSDYAANDTYGAENVWKSSYKGVWHLQATSGNAIDSTTNDNDLTDNNTVGTATGKIENCRDFERSNSEYFSIADASQSGLDFTTDFSIEGWVNIEALPSSTSGTYQLVNKNSGGAGGGGGYYVELRNDDTLRVGYYDLTTVRAKTTNNVFVSAGDVGNWVHLAITMDVSSGTATAYKNGSSVSITTNLGTATAVTGSSVDFAIGSNPSGGVGTFYDGLGDEFRVSNTILSADWITTEYNNQNSPSTFYTAEAPITYRLEVAGGTFTLTGSSVNLLIGYKILLATGSYVLTGFDVVFSRGYGMLCEVGSFTLMGFQAALLATRKIIASAGSFALTGASTTFTRGYKLVASAGQFILTGFNALLYRTGVRNRTKNTATGITNRVKN